MQDPYGKYNPWLDRVDIGEIIKRKYLHSLGKTLIRAKDGKVYHEHIETEQYGGGFCQESKPPVYRRIWSLDENIQERQEKAKKLMDEIQEIKEFLSISN